MGETTKRIMLAGGGTGGHVFPAVAVAQALGRLRPEVEVVFVGTERGLEARAIPKLGYRLETLDVLHLKGSGPLGWLKGLARLPMAGLQALRLLARERPAAVVSVGGYAAGPVTLMAALTGTPTALMEQNALPGITNRTLGKVVRRCFVSFEETREHLPPERCEVTGNPVRAELIEEASHDSSAASEAPQGRTFRILITGGSGGAGPLNADLPQLFRRLPEADARRLEVRHQAGRGRATQVVDDYRGFAGACDVVEFIDDMAAAYRWADLVICRAGATTLAELLVLGQPSMLVPFAGAADDHQARNAISVTQKGAALMVREHELLDGRAERLLLGLLRNPSSLASMRRQARALGRPEAAETIAREILALANV